MTSSIQNLVSKYKYDRQTYIISAIIGIIGIIVLMITTEVVEQRDFYNDNDDDDDNNNNINNNSKNNKPSFYFPMNVITLYGSYGIFVILLRMEWIKPLMERILPSCCCYVPSIDLFTEHNPYLLKQKVWCLFPCVCVLFMVVFGGIVHLIRSLVVGRNGGGGQGGAGNNGYGGGEDVDIVVEVLVYIMFLILIMFPLLAMMICAVSREQQTSPQTPQTLEEQRVESTKVHNTHIRFVFILITLHYVIITFDEHDMFNLHNFNFNVENCIYIVSYIVVSVCLYVIKYTPPAMTVVDSLPSSQSDYQLRQNDDNEEAAVTTTSSDAANDGAMAEANRGGGTTTTSSSPSPPTAVDTPLV